MSANIPSMAPLAVLSFLGAALALTVCLVIAVCALFGKWRRLLALAGAGSIVVFLGYGGVLLGFSLLSGEVDLPAGAKKYFCEIDCHLAYSVSHVSLAKSVGAESGAIVSRGEFVIVELQTWFDPTTISPGRGDGPLTPNGRVAILRDNQGQAFEPSPLMGEVLAAEGLHSTPLSTALRPGETYSSYLVFEVPVGADGWKLWLGSDDKVGTLLWGDERSPWHGKVLFLLGPTLRAAR